MESVHDSTSATPLKSNAEESPLGGEGPSLWVMIVAPFVALARPSRTAQRVNAARRWRRILLHVIASVFLLSVIFLIGATDVYIYSDRAQYTYGFTGVTADAPSSPSASNERGPTFRQAVSTYASEVIRDLWSPRLGPLWMILIVLGWEAALALMAVVFMPWGARDERLGDSYRAALGGVWLSVGSAAWIVAMVAALILAMEYRYYLDPYQPTALTWPTPPTPPSAPINAPGATKAWQDYNEAMQAYTTELSRVQAITAQASAEYWANRPWYIRFREEIAISAGVMGGALWVWLALRAIGASRMVPPVERPPMCEWCGYNLTTMAPEARCPECGAEVSTSLGPDARPGTECDRASWRLLPQAAMICMTQAIIAPRILGRRLSISREAHGGRRCLFVVLPMIGVIAGLALVAMILTLAHGGGDEIGAYIVGGVDYGIFCAVAGVAGMLVSALVMGWWVGMGVHRNLLPAAMQIACYLSGWLVIWAVVGAVTTYLTIYGLDRGVFRDMSNQTSFASEGTLALVGWSVPNIVMLAAYLYLLHQGLQASRYANR